MRTDGRQHHSHGGGDTALPVSVSRRLRQAGRKEGRERRREGGEKKDGGKGGGG